MLIPLDLGTSSLPLILRDAITALGKVLRQWAEKQPRFISSLIHYFCTTLEQIQISFNVMESSEDICYQFYWGDNNCLIFFWTMRHSYILLQSSTWSFTIYLMIFYLNRLKLLITVSHFRQSLFMYYKWFFLLPWGGEVCLEIQNKQSYIRRR